MSQPVPNELISAQIIPLLGEVFVKVEGAILDRGTSLCETLDTITAAEASKPTVPGGTTIASHTEHIRAYLKVTYDYIDGKVLENFDWGQTWLVRTVTESEWAKLRHQVREDYEALVAHVKGFADWNDERRLGGAMSIFAHTAFHLGAIRQMIKVVRG